MLHRVRALTPTALLMLLLGAEAAAQAGAAEAFSPEAFTAESELLADITGDSTFASSPLDPGSELAIDEMLAVLGQADPPLAGRLAQSQVARSPARLRLWLLDHVPGLRDLVRLRALDPELYAMRVRDIRLTRETVELAEALRRVQQLGERREADDLRETIEERVAAQFELRQAMRELAVARLEARLERLKLAVRERDRAERDLVEARVRELIGERF